MDLTWTQFRRAHKGMKQNEVSDLWSQYKEGTYKPKKAADEDPFEDFNEAYNIAYGGMATTDEAKASAISTLKSLVESTSPFTGYSANPSDGWTLWLGPTNNAILENHSQNIAFTITRAWWQMFGVGAVRVDTQVFDEQEQVLKVKEKFSRTKRLFSRYPLPGTEYKFSKNMNDAPVYWGEFMDESDLIARLTALEEANKPKKKVESFWVVHDPAFVKIWCPKSSCPNLGRKIEVEVQQIKASEAQGLTEHGEVKDLEESHEIIESKIIIDKGPSKSQHPLGVIAAFATEVEALAFTKNYYKVNQDRFAQMERPPALELIEIQLTS